MTAVVWPTTLPIKREYFAPTMAPAISGGRNESGVETVKLTAIGGLWEGFVEYWPATTVAEQRELTRLSALAKGGVTVFTVPLMTARLLAPNGSDFLVKANASAGAATITYKSAGSNTIDAGTTFSFAHATVGNKAYVVTSVSGDTLSILPLLREAVLTNLSLNFATPTVDMRLVNASEFRGPVYENLKSDAVAEFVEAF